MIKHNTNSSVKKNKFDIKNNLLINDIIESKIINNDDNDNINDVNNDSDDNSFEIKNIKSINKKLNFSNSDNFENSENSENSEKKIKLTGVEDDYIELEKLEKELVLKSGSNSLSHPKNYGNIWNENERDKIKKYLKKNKFDTSYGMFDESNIFDIAKKLQRSEFGVKEEIKKMIFTDYMNGLNYEKISDKFNIPTNNIKLILKFYMEKNSKKIINQMENENKLLKLKVENMKLKKELEELNNLSNT